MNKVMLIGRLEKKPELRYTQNGTPVTTMNIATDESYTDRDGNKVNNTEWHRVIGYQKNAENCSKYLVKGSLVYVEGKLQTRKWQDKAGHNCYTTEIAMMRIRFLDKKPDNHQSPPQSFIPQAQQANYDNYESDFDAALSARASEMDITPF